MTPHTPENGSGGQPSYTRIDSQSDIEHLEKECAENVYDQDALRSEANGRFSIEAEKPRGNVYMFRKSKRASLGAARII